MLTMYTNYVTTLIFTYHVTHNNHLCIVLTKKFTLYRLFSRLLKIKFTDSRRASKSFNLKLNM